MTAFSSPRGAPRGLLYGEREGTPTHSEHAMSTPCELQVADGESTPSDAEEWRLPPDTHNISSPLASWRSSGGRGPWP